MKVEKLRAEHILEIVKETVEAVEDYYVHGDTTLYNMVTEKMHLDYKMVSECFKFYADMRLIEYARNRKYTEMHGIDRNLDGETGKRKLQEKLSIDDESEEIFWAYGRRENRKIIKKLKSCREEIAAENNRVLLIKNHKVIERDWSHTYIRHEQMYFVLRGKYFDDRGIIKKWEKDFDERHIFVFYSEGDESKVDAVLNVINDYHKNPESTSYCNMDIAMEGRDDQGSLFMGGLIRSIHKDIGKDSWEMKLSPDWLKWEENDLYLVFDLMETPD